MPSTPSDTATPTEIELRACIAARLDEARRHLERLPAMERHLTPAASAKASELIDVCSALLAEIIGLNASLRDLPGLSLDGAFGSGSVSIAVSATADTISVLRAQLDQAAVA